MPKDVTLYKILVASPSDVKAERNAVIDVVHAWNAVNMDRYNAVLHPVLWETHSAPEMGGHPQDILNKNMVADCDMVVGVFWTKLGTATEKAVSGSVEEIEQFINAGKPALLYFSSVPVALDSVDQEQYARLREFKDLCYKRGLVAAYDTVGAFREAVRDHLTQHINRVHIPQRPDTSPKQEEESAQISALRAFQEQVKAFIRHFEADWEGERDSEPMNIDDGQFIVRRACDRLVEFRAMITLDKGGEFTEKLAGLIKDLRSLQRHRLYIDGGASYREFWTLGDAAIVSLKEISQLLEKEISKVASLGESS